MRELKRERTRAEQQAIFANLKAGRTQGAINRDLSLRAAETLPNTPENVKLWQQNPRRIDIEGIDTPNKRDLPKINKGKSINNSKDNSSLSEKAGVKTTMEIKSKSGTVLDIEVTGTQENPIITAKPFEVGGRKVKGAATIQHWKSKGAEEGLLFKTGDVYVQAAKDMPKIKDAIKQLPHRKIRQLGISKRDEVYLKKQVELAEWRKETFDDAGANQALRDAYYNAGTPKHLQSHLSYDS